ncbi:hypothetical protein VNI00_007717 [Paramarasmius palmivorus]|uniref:Cytochrome P450 n=1 Tax=Paramarasmius palmivorus TaxID=297713 RepID=A0AAW0D263_9AGAR
MASLSPTQILIAAIFVWLLKNAIQRYVAVVKTLWDIGSCPGRGRLFYNPFGGLSLAMDRWSPLKWRFHDYHATFDPYKHYGSTILSSFVIWNGEPYYWLGDADAIKTVCNSKTVFQKDLVVYEGFLNFWGTNIISTEGAEWKAHRSIAKTAFNEANNALVWQETSRLVSEWMGDMEKSGEDTHVDLLEDLRLITMQVIQAAGFGRRPDWAETFHNRDKTNGGQLLPFEEALSASASLLIPRSITPTWLIDIAERVHVPKVGPKLTMIRKGFNDIKFHMLDLVALARTWMESDNKDRTLDAALLRNLVEANSAEEGSKRLTDGELLSNAFVFLVAGHETTAHSLSFMIAFMAVYPDVQRKVSEEVAGLTSGDLSIPLSYKEHLSKLVYTTAVFHESIRLCTVAPRLGRVAIADTTLQARRFKVGRDGSPQDVEEFPVNIRQGAQVLMDLTAVHMNPIHWGKDVHEFRPERFIDTDTYKWPRDAFLAFSTGHRSCIGQKFSTTESLCLVANLVRKFEILPPPDLQGRPLSEQKSITDWKTWLTTTPANARISLRRRV